MTFYCTSFNLVRYLTLLLFADTWPKYSCIRRNSVYLRLGEKEIPLHREEEHFFMHDDIMPHFFRQEAEAWQAVFLFWG